jgi:hypothetical protein
MVALRPAGEMALRVSVSMLCLATIARLETRSSLAIGEALIILATFLFYTYEGLFLACKFSIQHRRSKC